MLHRSEEQFLFSNGGVPSSEGHYEIAMHFLDDILSKGVEMMRSKAEERMKAEIELVNNLSRELLNCLRQSLPSAMARNDCHLYLASNKFTEVKRRTIEHFIRSYGVTKTSFYSLLTDLESYLITHRLNLTSSKLEVCQKDLPVKAFPGLEDRTQAEVAEFAAEKLLENKDRLQTFFQKLIMDGGLENFKSRLQEVLYPLHKEESVASDEFSFPVLERSLPSLPLMSCFDHHEDSKPLIEVEEIFTPMEVVEEEKTRSLEPENFVLCNHPLAINQEKEESQSDLSENSCSHFSPIVQAIFKEAPKKLHYLLEKPTICGYAARYLQEASKPLRKFQIDFIRLCGDGLNYVFCASDLKNKTKLLVNCARYRLDRQKISRIVVVEPTGTLAAKQAAVFILEGLPEAGYGIQAYLNLSSNPSDQDFTNSQIIITTPHNLLKGVTGQVLDFSRIDLLILDEFHYCRGDRDYLLITELYRKTVFPNRQCQVLGFTHTSSMGGSSDDPGVLGMEILLMKINAKYVTASTVGNGIHVREPRLPDEVRFDALCEDNLQKYNV